MGGACSSWVSKRVAVLLGLLIADFPLVWRNRNRKNGISSLCVVPRPCFRLFLLHDGVSGCGRWRDMQTDRNGVRRSYLANIYGSEQDKVNCAFWTKIGACRHGDRCSRKHIKPLFSQTLVVANMYQNPTHSNVPGAVQRPGESAGAALNEQQLKEYFDQFCQSTILPQSLPLLTLPLLTRFLLSPRRPSRKDEDVYCELTKFGSLLEMHVCDNVGDHLIGNVYARYDWEEDTAKAVDSLNSRWYAGQSLSLLHFVSHELTECA